MLALAMYCRLSVSLLYRANTDDLFCLSIFCRKHPRMHGLYTRKTSLQWDIAYSLLTGESQFRSNEFHPLGKYNRTIYCLMRETFEQSNFHKRIQDWLTICYSAVSDTKMFLLRKHPDTKMFCVKMWPDTKIPPCNSTIAFRCS